jgi:Acyclic terpene utilisation family protein AtuA
MRIGCGAGFSSDRLSPAVDLARDGRLDWLVFECIGERTMAFGHRDRRLDAGKGYNPHLAARMRGVLAHCRANKTRIITNMGVANVPAAVAVTRMVAQEMGLAGLTIAGLEGDDVTAQIGADARLFDHHDTTVAEVGLPVVGANAYLGADALLAAIQTGADVIIAGRVADPSLFVAPYMATYDVAGDDWSRLGAGTLVGHLLECGMQVTGGYFADPGFKDVPRLADCGYPIATVAADGSAVISKLAAAGGRVTTATVKEQLLYEVHDPAAYITPDVVADFSRVRIAEERADHVAVAGAGGTVRPHQLKVTVGFDGGFLAEAGISYAGPGAVARGQLAIDILRQRLLQLGLPRSARIDLIGVNALHATGITYESDARDVRVQASLRTVNRGEADMLLWEVEAMLCCGPAGGGGYRGQISPSVLTHSTLIDRDRIRPVVTVVTA